MTNVVRLQDRLQARREGEGEMTFMFCPCNQVEPESLIPVVLHDVHGPLIVGLMCPLCEADVGVLNGRPVQGT